MALTIADPSARRGRRGTGGDGLACVLDEVFGDANPATASHVDANMAEDLGRAAEWVRAALAVARAQSVSFQSLALVLPDVAPYRLQLALADVPVHGEAEWADSITWRSSDDFASAVLDGLLPLFSGLRQTVQRKADHLVPLAYAAFLLRDVLRTADATEWHPVRAAPTTRVLAPTGCSALRSPAAHARSRDRIDVRPCRPSEGIEAGRSSPGVMDGGSPRRLGRSVPILSGALAPGPIRADDSGL